MREITFIRKKNSALAGVRVSVFAETKGNGTIEINNTPCTLLGSLNNGGRLTLSLDESDIKLFFVTEDASGSETSIGLIPAGANPMEISGEIGRNPDGKLVFGITSTKQSESKKKSKGIIIIAAAVVLLAALTVGIFSIFSHVKMGDPKEFTYESLHITLTDNFGGTNYIPDHVDYALKAQEVYVWIIKTKHEDTEQINLNGIWSAEIFAQKFAKEEGSEKIKVESVIEGTIAKFVYDKENPDGRETYRYHTYVYRGKLAFWTVQFITSPEDSNKYDELITQWANSVKIIEGNNDSNN